MISLAIRAMMVLFAIMAFSLSYAGSINQFIGGTCPVNQSVIAISPNGILTCGSTATSTSVILCSSGVPFTIGATVAETTAATCNVPANAMGANGIIEIFQVWTSTPSIIKTLRTRFAGNLMMSLTSGAAGPVSQNFNVTFANRNDPTSQIGACPAGGTVGNLVTLGNCNNAVFTSAVDTTSSQNILLTGQKTNTTDTLILEFYEIKLYMIN